MKYTIPGIDGYYIDDDFTVFNDTNKVEGDSLTLTLFGVRRVYNTEWLYWLSRYELDLPNNCPEVVDNLDFVKGDNRYGYCRYDKFPIFKRPVSDGAGSYRVPLNPKAVLGPNGSLNNKPTPSPDNSEAYPGVTIPKYGELRLHVLMALVFIPNTDYVRYPIVNHLDGDKYNWNYTNLEWCDYGHNNQHAFETGLRTDNCPCKLRSFRTGEILHFCSLQRTAVFLGLDPTRLRLGYIFSNPRRLYKNEYELKFEDDNSPWYHVGAPKDFRSRYVITVTDSEGNETTHYGIRDLIKLYKLWNLSKGVPELVDILRERRPDLKVEYEDRRPEFRFDLLNVKTKEDHRNLTLGAVKALTGINGSYLCENARLPPERVFRGWLIKYHDGLDWPAESTWEHHKARARRIAASRVDREEIAVFDSFRHCSKVLGIDRDALKLRLRNNKDWNGWTFTEFEE